MATPSPFNRPLFSAPGSGAPQAFQQLQAQSFGEGGIASRGATAAGRSMYDPNRVAERAYRQSRNPNLLMQMHQQKSQQNFYRERDAQNFAQQQQMAAQGWQQQQQMEAERQKQQAARDAAQWQQQMTIYGINQGAQAMETERKRLQDEADRRNQAVNGFEVMTDPSGRFTLPGVRTQGGDFRPMGGAYPVPQTAPSPQIEWKQVPGTNQFVPFYGDRPVPGLPVHTGSMVPGSYVRQSTQGMPQAPMQYTPPATERVTTDSLTGAESRTFERPLQSTPSPAPAAPGAATPGAAPAAGGPAFQPFKTKSGYDVAPAGMQAGQLPNLTQSSPLTPEQSLRAAHDEYARGGYTDASVFDRHFANFPSEQARRLAQPTSPQARVMTQAEALAALNAPPAPPPVAPTQVTPTITPQWIGGKIAAPYQWAFRQGAQALQSVSDYARRNPLVTLRQ